MGRTKKMMQDLGTNARNEKAENQKGESHEGDSGTISQAKLNENWKDYLTNHPFNHRVARVKGEIFDKINSYQGKMYCFPVKLGCSVKDGDIVMLNQYCEAYAIEDHYNVSYEEWIMSEIIGTAELLIYMSNGHGIVFVKECNVFEFTNSSDPKHAVTRDDICKACYLEDPEDSDIVCMNSLRPFAGQIMGIEGDTVSVFVSLNIKDRKKWIWDQDAFVEDSHESV